jgi:hypothetical protein
MCSSLSTRWALSHVGSTWWPAGIANFKESCLPDRFTLSRSLLSHSASSSGCLTPHRSDVPPGLALVPCGAPTILQRRPCCSTARRNADLSSRQRRRPPLHRLAVSSMSYPSWPSPGAHPPRHSSDHEFAAPIFDVRRSLVVFLPQLPHPLRRRPRELI